jgi:hypothetical protein
MLVLTHTLACRLHEVKELGLRGLHRELGWVLGWGFRVKKMVIVSSIMVNLWDVVWLV